MVRMFSASAGIHGRCGYVIQDPRDSEINQSMGYYIVFDNIIMNIIVAVVLSCCVHMLPG